MINPLGRTRWTLRLIFASLIVLSRIGTTEAATITVTNTNPDGDGSLRQAVVVAAAGDVIEFDLPGYPATISVSTEIVINKDLTIHGPAADQVILAGVGFSRIFRITSGTVTLDGMTMTGGRSSGPSGGAILITRTTSTVTTVTVSNCVINHSGTSSFGGGISNFGTLTIINSSISDNFAHSNGGGIANNGTGILTIINSTIANNESDAMGGAISNIGTLTAVNTTISGNSAIDIGGGINAGGNETLSNALIAGNYLGWVTPNDIGGGTIDTADYDLVGDSGSAGGIANGIAGSAVGNDGVGALDISTVLDVQLVDNGGPTFTLALVCGSPALNAGHDALAMNADNTPLTTDQRGVGFQRIADGFVDIGAFERQQSCIYQFAGFFQPVDNLPTVNMVTAGSAIPVRFSLNGNKGLDIFAAGYPASAVIQCGSLDAVSTVEETVNAGGSTLNYDPTTDQYNYVWKTNKAWKGTCRQLVVKLSDDTIHAANVKFK